MKSDLRICLCILVVLLSACQFIAAEENQERSVAVLDFMDFTEKPEKSAQLALVFGNSIGLELTHKNFKLLDRKTFELAFEAANFPAMATLDRDTIIHFAASQGADVVVTGFYTDDDGTLTAGIRAYDVLSGRLAVSLLQSGETGLAVFDSIDTMAAAVAAKIRERLPPLTPAELVIRKEKVTVHTTVVQHIVEKGNLVPVTVHGFVEGADLYVGDHLVGTIHNGIATIQVKEGASAIVSQKHDGWRDEKDTIATPTAGTTYPLSLPFKLTNFELGFSLITQAPLGLTAEFKWYPIPDYLFASIDASGLVISGTVIPQPGVGSFVEFRSNLHFGTYFIDSSSPVRLAVFGGVGTDLYIPNQAFGQIGLQIGLRIEYNHPTGKIFAEIRSPLIGPLWSNLPSSFKGLSSLQLGYAVKL